MGLTLPTSLRRTIRTAMPPVQRSSLEQKFLTLWRLHGGPPLAEQHRFHPTRRWRADFAHVASRTLIECEGGTWKLGRHNRGDGYDADCEKYNAAQQAGWKVYRLTGKLVAGEHILPIIADVISRAAHPFAGKGLL